MDMFEKLEAMSDSEVLSVWESFRGGFTGSDFYDAARGITMNEWAEAVYSEISRRGISDQGKGTEENGNTKKFLLHWIEGKEETVEGTDIADACRRAGIGNGALPAIDYYEKIK